MTKRAAGRETPCAALDRDRASVALCSRKLAHTRVMRSEPHTLSLSCRVGHQIHSCGAVWCSAVHTARVRRAIRPLCQTHPPTSSIQIALQRRSQTTHVSNYQVVEKKNQGYGLTWEVSCRAGNQVLVCKTRRKRRGAAGLRRNTKRGFMQGQHIGHSGRSPIVSTRQFFFSPQVRGLNHSLPPPLHEHKPHYPIILILQGQIAPFTRLYLTSHR